MPKRRGSTPSSGPVPTPTWDDMVQGARAFMQEGIVSKEQVYTLCSKLIQDKLRYLEYRKRGDRQTTYDRRVMEEIQLLMLMMCQISGRVNLPDGPPPAPPIYP